MEEQLKYLEAMQEHLARWGSIDDIKKEKEIRETIKEIQDSLFPKKEETPSKPPSS